MTVTIAASHGAVWVGRAWCSLSTDIGFGALQEKKHPCGHRACSHIGEGLERTWEGSALLWKGSEAIQKA